MENNDMKTKCLIIGSGPAGYTAAIYAGRAGLNPTLYAGLQMGGQLTQTTDIENFPGFPDGIDANEMMENFRKQAARFDADIRDGVITDVDFNQKPYVVTTDRGEKIEADTIIVATGASAKYLGLPDEEKYRGQGVSACATCDGSFYRKKVVAVVGGGDTACEEATYLANLCSKVYMIVRKPYLRASEIMKKRVEDNPKIEILYETNTLGLYGDNGVEGAHVVYRKGEADEKKYDLPIDGFFLAIGHKPNTDIFRGKLDMDEVGYIKTQGDTPRTNIEGVYAAGDCADPTYRQAVVAAGSGCKAALEAERYLQGK
jgi:thioredoxin reductase (NADPH)